MEPRWAEPATPFTGPGLADPAPRRILQQESWPHPSGESDPLKSPFGVLGKDGSTPHHRCIPHLGRTLELTVFVGYAGEHGNRRAGPTPLVRHWWQG